MNQRKKIMALSVMCAMSQLSIALPTSVTFKQGSGDFNNYGDVAEIKITSFNSKKTAFAVADNLNVGANEILSIYKDNAAASGGRFLLLDKSGLRGRIDGTITNGDVKTFMIYPKGVTIGSTAVINDNSGIIFVPGDVTNADTIDSEADVTIVLNRIGNNTTNGGVKVQEGATVNLSSSMEFLGVGLDENGGAYYCGQNQYRYDFLYSQWNAESGIHLDTGDLTNTVEGAFSVSGAMHYEGNVSFKDIAFPTVNIDGINTKATTTITVDQYGNPYSSYDDFINRANEIDANVQAWIKPIEDQYTVIRNDRDTQLTNDLNANATDYSNAVIDETTYYSNMDAIYDTYNADRAVINGNYNADMEARYASKPDNSDYRFDLKSYANTNQYDIQAISANGTTFMHNVKLGNDMKIDGNKVVLSKVDMGGNTIHSNSDVAVTQWLRNGTLNASSIGIDTKNQNLATYTFKALEFDNVTVNANTLKEVFVDIGRYTDPTWYNEQAPDVTDSNDILSFNIKNSTFNINGDIVAKSRIEFLGDNNSTLNAHDINTVYAINTDLNVYGMYNSGINHGNLSVTGSIIDSSGNDMLNITLANDATLMNSSFISNSDATVTGRSLVMDNSFFGGFGTMTFHDLTMRHSSGINIDVAGHDFDEVLSPISSNFNLTVNGNLDMSYSHIGAKTGSYNDVNFMGTVTGQQNGSVSDWGAITAQSLYVNPTYANRGHYGDNTMIASPSSSAYLAVAGSTAISDTSRICWNNCALQRYVAPPVVTPPVPVVPPVTPPVEPPVTPPIVPPVEPPIVPPVTPPIVPPVVTPDPVTPSKPDIKIMAAPAAYVVKATEVSETTIDRSTLYVPRPYAVDDNVEIVKE